MKKFEYLLKIAMSAKNESCTNDNYYIDKLIGELKIEAIKEKSLKSVLYDYMKDVKRQTPDFNGYYVIDGSIYFCDNFSFIKIFQGIETVLKNYPEIPDNKKERIVNDKSILDYRHKKSTIEALLKEYNNQYFVDIDINCIEIDIFELLNRDDYLQLTKDFKVDLQKLLIFAMANKHYKLNIYFDSKIGKVYVLSECKTFLGIVLPMKAK